MMKPKLFEQEVFTDKRGHLSYFNDLNLEKFKRIYYITHTNTEIIRAWQGHQNEAKLFKVINGSFVLSYVKLGNLSNPSKTF